MGIQVQGFGGTIAEVSGTGFRALRVQAMPVEYGALGSYTKALLSGTMAAGLAANAEIWQFRWSDASRLGLLQGIIFDGFAGSATAFTAGFAKIDLLLARAFSASGTGGTAGTLTGNNGKLRTSMGTTLLGDIRCATTAALGVGTKTLDTDPIGQVSFGIGVVVSVNYLGRTPLFGNFGSDDAHPIVLAQNEGAAIRATVPATGTWQFGVTCRWAEVASY